MKRKVMLANYSDGEGQCKCGCGLQLKDDILLRLQAFIYRLENLYQCHIRHVINSGMRCEAHNKKVGGSQTSQHLSGKAADGNFEMETGNDIWVKIPVADIAAQAIQSRLFTGVGYSLYKGEFIHLDCRPTRIMAIW